MEFQHTWLLKSTLITQHSLSGLMLGHWDVWWLSTSTRETCFLHCRRSWILWRTRIHFWWWSLWNLFSRSAGVSLQNGWSRCVWETKCQWLDWLMKLPFTTVKKCEAKFLKTPSNFISSFYLAILGSNQNLVFCSRFFISLKNMFLNNFQSIKKHLYVTHRYQQYYSDYDEVKSQLFGGCFLVVVAVAVSNVVFGSYCWCCLFGFSCDQ